MKIVYWLALIADQHQQRLGKISLSGFWDDQRQRFLGRSAPAM